MEVNEGRGDREIWERDVASRRTQASGLSSPGSYINPVFNYYTYKSVGIGKLYYCRLTVVLCALSNSQVH